MSNLNALGSQFVAQLSALRSSVRAQNEQQSHVEKVHVVGAGGTLSAVYEQLRNAAEYTEEHLLVQRAIRRFYRRLFLARNVSQIETSGEELVVELTLAGYLKNDTVTVETAKQISQLAQQYYAAHGALSGQGTTVERWTINVLAVEVEMLINDHGQQAILIQLAHGHFAQALAHTSGAGARQPDFEVALFAAIHRALLHSDAATIRTMLLKRYGITTAGDLDLYRSTNEKIDQLLGSEAVENLYRIVNRQGAPFRILWRMVQDQPEVAELLQSREKFLRAYESQITHEYDQIHRRINAGIIKSVIFLIITKFLVGIAIEVPYDYAVHGSIVWLPLIINLFFPPVYMLLLRATLIIPGGANTAAMVELIDRFLYGGQTSAAATRRKRTFGAAYNALYALFFLLVFGGVAWFLIWLGFSIVHLFIFFVFLSAASFLGFRLSGMIRELEVVDSHQGGVTVVRDFLYMPFVVVGRWISEKYSKMNVVATFLDMVIELPLKTVLRLVRQWSAFISSKKDEL